MMGILLGSAIGDGSGSVSGSAFGSALGPTNACGGGLPGGGGTNLPEGERFRAKTSALSSKNLLCIETNRSISVPDGISGRR